MPEITHMLMWAMSDRAIPRSAVSWVAYFKALSLGSATPVTAIDKRAWWSP